jgi:dipeptidyl aminopeptidase/acylaminoacyl peptidase
MKIMNSIPYIIIACVLITACGPSSEEIKEQTALAATQTAEGWTSTPTATSTSTSTPTETPTPTATSTPTSTPTPIGGGSGTLLFYTDDILNSLDTTNKIVTQIVDSNAMETEETSLTLINQLPNGIRFLLTHFDSINRQSEIWITNPTGTEFIELLPDVPGAKENPALSPDGRYIAFTGSPWFGPRVLYVMHSDGTDLRQLTEESNFDVERGISWSPDSTAIAYSFGYPSGKIHLIDVDGTNDRIIGDGNSPLWSPDGNRVLYQDDNRYTTNCWIMNSDGTDVHQVSDLGPALIEGMFRYGPSCEWFPDGTQIFIRHPVEFVGSGPHPRPAMSEYISVNYDGTGQTLLFSDIGYPVLSPDGTVVAIGSDDGLYLVNLDGTGRELVFSSAEEVRVQPNGWIP